MTINNKSTINYERKRFAEVEIGETFVAEDEDYGYIESYIESSNLYLKTEEYLLKDFPATCPPRNAFSFERGEMARFSDDEIVVMVTAEINFTLNGGNNNDF